MSIFQVSFLAEVQPNSEASIGITNVTLIVGGKYIQEGFST